MIGPPRLRPLCDKETTELRDTQPNLQPASTTPAIIPTPNRTSLTGILNLRKETPKAVRQAPGTRRRIGGDMRFGMLRLGVGEATMMTMIYKA